ncbi:hypothetical protein L211DRAFT_619500 [Terfezia boudieri ATCC MYA-4762]|uniref:Uncharacterized protein n=1 Tax=Terfezia boudieri ATCC MYA-4762 TaxID=1051890 RepID=A0A3N4LWN9_9PEZI|nr:hypothetical protein L211DRAFT_619500 [Terfezia boudieri ATCC MYA-4762]
MGFLKAMGKIFRTDFVRLGSLRTRLPKIPFGACTATAFSKKLKKIHEGMGFHGKKTFIPTVQLGETFDISLIPKMLVYIDHKQDAPKIADEIRLLLPPNLCTRPPRPTVWNGNPRSQVEVIVCIFHAEISPTMKNIVIQDWKAGKSRIRIASSAWGLGINEKDTWMPLYSDLAIV